MRLASDIIAASQTLTEEAHGGSHLEALAFLLSVEELEAEKLLADGILVALDRIARARERKGIANVGLVYMLTLALETGIEMGVAAERCRRGDG